MLKGLILTVTVLVAAVGLPQPGGNDIRTALALETIIWPDLDGDGCADVEEQGSIAAYGGQRNPSNARDFYDLDGDHEVG